MRRIEAIWQRINGPYACGIIIRGRQGTDDSRSGLDSGYNRRLIEITSF